MNAIRLLLKLLLFWLIFFTVQQCLFLAVNFSSYKGGAGPLLFSFAKAFPLNLSTAVYLLSLPVLVVIAGIFGMKEKWVNAIIKWETIIMIVVCSMIAASDMGLFKVWGTKTNAKALGYLIYPEEVLPTLFSVENAGLLLIILAQVVFALWLRKRLGEPFKNETFSFSYKILFSVVAVGLCILGFRGGFQKLPINRNWVFHSPYPVLNYAALNSFWNLANIISHPVSKQQNPYLFFNAQESEKLTGELHHTPADSTFSILNTDKPNIIIIFLESWGADAMECLGGEKDVAPKFSALAKEGLLFTRFYSTGYRTEQGYLASLSATPALPVGSVIQSFGTFDKLPNIYRTFNDLGYHTSFYTGGRLFFDNIEAYLRSAGVQTIKGENEWEIRKRTVWGAYDEETFAMHLGELKTMSQPFFSVMTTMTTHEWFDADVPQLFNGDADKVNDHYRNTMHYADSCLYTYIQQAKLQPWYKNTLFLIVADHACMFPKNRDNDELEMHHIPMLLTGGALALPFRGKTTDRIASHVDIPATLLGQLHQPAGDFPYSKNLFNSYTPAFAYYTFDNGFGLIEKNGHLIYDHNQQKETFVSGDSIWGNKWKSFGKAYLQRQFQENLDYATKKHRE